ncbi:MAG: peptidase M14, partial [Candidatus Solibacter sp.]|nr:peptidase M14 [Candidatus Solibacter sp.]
EIYDVTAWSLPLLFNVEAVANNAVSPGSFEPATASRIVPGQMHGASASVAYLVPWGNQAAGRLLTAALRQDLKIHSSDKPFTQDNVKFPAGSLIIKVAANPADLGDRLARLARETGAEVYGTNSGWVEDGVNFGSRWVVPIKKPAIAIAWDTPAQSGSAGATRFVLERQYGYPVTPIRTAQLAATDLSKFQVLILPSGGNYAGILGDGGVERIKNWVAAGGTIVAVGDAVNFLGNSKVDLLELVQENALREGEEKKPAEKTEKTAGRVPGTAIASETDFDKITRAASELPDSAPGAIARVRIRPDYWLTAGMGDTVYTMVEGRAIYAPVKADKGINAAYYDAADKLVVSGHLWAENKKQMAFKPLVVSGTSGRGVVVGFTQDPNFRAIGDGLNILFLNAIFRGPAHARGGGGE